MTDQNLEPEIPKWITIIEKIKEGNEKTKKPGPESNVSEDNISHFEIAGNMNGFISDDINHN